MTQIHKFHSFITDGIKKMGHMFRDKFWNAYEFANLSKTVRFLK